MQRQKQNVCYGLEADAVHIIDYFGRPFGDHRQLSICFKSQPQKLSPWRLKKIFLKDTFQHHQPASMTNQAVACLEHLTLEPAIAATASDEDQCTCVLVTQHQRIRFMDVFVSVGHMDVFAQ